MNKSPGDLEARLRGLGNQAPPPELRARVLAAVALQPAVTWRDRVWFSTGWRVAATALLLALLAADRWAVPPRHGGSPGNDPAAAAERQALEALGSEIGMPPETMRRLAGRGGSAPHPARLTIDDVLATLADSK